MHIVSISYNFFPEDLIGTEISILGIMHFIVTALVVPLSICSPLIIGIGLKRNSSTKKFGIFSIICSISIFIFGGITVFLLINKLPYFGLFERINIGILQIWTVTLSIFLFFRKTNKESHNFT